MDKRVNEALHEQREKLNKIRDKRQQGLKNIYKLVKDNNSSGGTLAAKYKPYLTQSKARGVEFDKAQLAIRKTYNILISLLILIINEPSQAISKETA